MGEFSKKCVERARAIGSALDLAVNGPPQVDDWRLWVVATHEFPSFRLHIGWEPEYTEMRGGYILGPQKGFRFAIFEFFEDGKVVHNHLKYIPLDGYIYFSDNGAPLDADTVAELFPEEAAIWPPIATRPPYSEARMASGELEKLVSVSGLTQRGMANSLGVPLGLWREWENGSRPIPSWAAGEIKKKFDHS